MRSVIYYLVPAVLYAALVLVLSLLPDSGVPSYGWDKARHFIAYAVMSFLFTRAAAAGGVSSARAALAAVGAATLFGIGVEFLQSLTSTRNAETLDALANTLGALLGAALFSFIKYRAEVKRCL